jgi:hypothetical protein
MNSSKSRQRGKTRKGRKGGSVGSQMLSSHHLTAKGDVVTVPEDFKRKQVSWSIGGARPPRNFLTQIHWIQSTVKTVISVAGNGAVVELNQSFSLSNNVNDYTSYSNVFDQYCMFCASVRVAFTSSTAALTGNLGRLYTAIDYDNVSNISTENAIMEFGSAEVTEIGESKSVERYVEPACYILAAASSQALGRSWFNVSTPGSPHYGVRIMTAGNTSTSSGLACDVLITVIVGFRNNI